MPGEPVAPTILQRREDIGEHVGVALDQALEGHAFVQVDAVFHDEMLVAGVEHLGVDRRHDLDGEIVGADDDDLKAREPAGAFEHDAGRAVVEGRRLGVPARAVAGAHERPRRRA